MESAGSPPISGHSHRRLRAVVVGVILLITVNWGKYRGCGRRSSFSEFDVQYQYLPSAAATTIAVTFFCKIVVAAVDSSYYFKVAAAVTIVAAIVQL